MHAFMDDHLEKNPRTQFAARRLLGMIEEYGIDHEPTNNEEYRYKCEKAIDIILLCVYYDDMEVLPHRILLRFCDVMCVFLERVGYPLKRLYENDLIRRRLKLSGFTL